VSLVDLSPVAVFTILTRKSGFENEVMGYASIYDRTYLVIVFGPSSPGCSFSEPKRANLTRDPGNDRIGSCCGLGGLVLLLGSEKKSKSKIQLPSFVFKNAHKGGWNSL
jgi:hypothetical protein